MSREQRHGGDIYAAAAQLGCRPSEIIDFSANINIVAPAVNVAATPELIRNYGDPRYTELYGAAAERFGMESDEIALFNGASSAIMELLRMLQPDACYLYTPIYGEYVRAAERYSRKSHLVNRFKALDTRPKKHATVVFVNPSTPDGKYYDLERLFAIWREAKCTIIVDESFLEFTQKPSVRHLVRTYKRLYVIQSFTKFYACAGLRAGAIFSRSRNISRFMLPAWGLSSFDAAYVTELLKDNDHARRSHSAHQQHYRILRTILKSSGLFEKVYKSEANFVLTRSDKAPQIRSALFAQKILVRDCSSFEGLDHRYLRFAVKDKKALQQLHKALHALT